MKNYLVFMLILIILSSIVVSGEQAPDFQVDTSDGETFILSENLDKPVVIDFMTPDCLACVELEESLKNIYDDYSEEFHIISIDISGSDLEELRSIKESREIPWTLAKGDSTLTLDYGVISVPTLVIIGEDQEVLMHEVGVLSTERLRGELDEVLEGKKTGISIPVYGTYLIAIMGGIAAFFSPCALPLLPSYISYRLGSDVKEKGPKDIISIALKASSGMVLVFGIIGGILIIGGSAIIRYISNIELFIAISIIIIGLTMLLHLDLDMYITKLTTKIRSSLGLRKKNMYPTPFFYGIAYGSAASICAAPIFAAVIMSSWLRDGVSSSLLILLIFLLTMAIFMLLFIFLVVYLGSKLDNFDNINKYIRPISAWILVIMGTYLLWRILL